MCVKIESLTPTRCHWPLGEPRSAEFCYCGERIEKPGKNYCEHHERTARAPRSLLKPIRMPFEIRLIERKPTDDDK